MILNYIFDRNQTLKALKNNNNEIKVVQRTRAINIKNAAQAQTIDVIAITSIYEIILEKM